jgi:hypothetical protein
VKQKKKSLSIKVKDPAGHDDVVKQTVGFFNVKPSSLERQPPWTQEA